MQVEQVLGGRGTLHPACLYLGGGICRRQMLPACICPGGSFLLHTNELFFSGFCLLAHVHLSALPFSISSPAPASILHVSDAPMAREQFPEAASKHLPLQKRCTH